VIGLVTPNKAAVVDISFGLDNILTLMIVDAKGGVRVC
jgi:hypothetical protein